MEIPVSLANKQKTAKKKSLAKKDCRGGDRHKKHWTIRYREEDVLRPLFAEYNFDVELILQSDFNREHWNSKILNNKNVGIHFPCLGYKILITYIWENKEKKLLGQDKYLFAFLLFKYRNQLSEYLTEQPLKFKKRVRELWDHADLVHRKWGTNKKKLVPLVSYGVKDKQNEKKPLLGYNWASPNYRLKEDIAYWLWGGSNRWGWRNVGGLGGENLSFDFDHDKMKKEGRISEKQWKRAEQTFQFLINSLKVAYWEKTLGGKKVHVSLRGVEIISTGMWLKYLGRMGEILSIGKYTVLPVCKGRNIFYTRWRDKTKSLYEQEKVIGKNIFSWFKWKVSKIGILSRDPKEAKENIKKEASTKSKTIYSKNIETDKKKDLQQVKILSKKDFDTSNGDEARLINYFEEDRRKVFCVNLYQKGNEYGRERVEKYFEKGGIINCSLVLGKGVYWVNNINF